MYKRHSDQENVADLGRKRTTPTMYKTNLHPSKCRMCLLIKLLIHFTCLTIKNSMRTYEEKEQTCTINILITARIRRLGKGNIFSLCVSSHLDLGGGTYLGWGRGTYLGWERGYLPWMGEGVPTLDGGGGTYLGRGGELATWQVVCLLHSCRRTFLL